jgi:hypothetical protein
VKFSRKAKILPIYGVPEGEFLRWWEMEAPVPVLLCPPGSERFSFAPAGAIAGPIPKFSIRIP